MEEENHCKQYPEIEGVEPKLLLSTNIPRKEKRKEIENIKEVETHLNRGIYEFDGKDITIVPDINKTDTGDISLYWKLEVGSSKIHTKKIDKKFQTPQKAIDFVRENKDNISV